MNSPTLPKELIIIGKKEISKKKFEEIENNYNFTKPYGGLWASPYMLKGEYVSAWHEHCEDSIYDLTNEHCVIITIKQNAKWYCINSQDDLIFLINSIGGYEVKALDEEYITKCIDFEKAKKEFDIIYLTEKGINETYEPQSHKKYNLDHWSCESCLILNYDCIDIDKCRYKRLNI